MRLNIVLASPVPLIVAIQVANNVPLTGTKIVGATGAVVSTVNVVIVLTAPVIQNALI